MLATPHNPPAVHCRNHPKRSGVGVCMACRKVVCAECTTRFEGVGHCAECVASMREAGAEEKGRSASRILPVWALALSIAVVVGGYGFLHMWLLW